MLIVPLGIAGRGWEHGRVPVTITGLVLAGVLAVIDVWGWQWPRPWSAMADAVVWLRLYSGAEDTLFRPWQVWSTALMHQTWLGLAIGAVTWWICVGACERRLGSLLTLVLLVVVTPATAATAVLIGRGMPDVGLLGPAVAVGAGILGLLPRTAIRWWLGWWALRVVGTKRGTFSLAGWLLVAVIASLLVLSNTVDPRFSAAEAVRLVGVGLALGALVGQIMVRGLLTLNEPRTSVSLAEIIDGRVSLERLGEALSTAHDVSRVHIEQIGDRAMHQGDRQAVRVLIAHLVVHDSQASVLSRLRSWLATGSVSENELVS